MPCKKSVKQRHHFRGIKKKSDDFLKRRAEEKNKKADPLPVHAIKEPALADKSFQLPKIPQKHEVTIPPVQLSIAEIIEEVDHNLEIKLEEAKEEEIVIEPGSIVPLLSVEELLKCNAIFAEKQKVSIVPLIKLLQPSLEGNQVIIRLTKQQEEFIGDIKISWQAHLREYFKDRSLTLQIRIDEVSETKKVAYTPSEQFREMLDSNDSFRKFVNTFKLKLKQ